MNSLELDRGKGSSFSKLAGSANLEAASNLEAAGTSDPTVEAVGGLNLDFLALPWSDADCALDAPWPDAARACAFAVQGEKNVVIVVGVTRL